MSKDKHNKNQQNQEQSRQPQNQQQNQHQNQQKQQQHSQQQQQRGGSQGTASNPDLNIQVDEDRETKKWTVHPTIRSSEAVKWIVECNSKNEANSLKNDLVNGKVKPPTEAPQQYASPRKHNNGKTMIYAKVA